MTSRGIESVTGEPYCHCGRWRRFVHIPSEHARFEARAELLTPRRWKREHSNAALATKARAMSKAERVSYLKERSWSRVSSYGAQTWRSPEYPADRSFYTLAAATYAALEQEAIA